VGVRRSSGPAPELRLRLLGGARVERGDAPVALDTRKAVALLAFLAVTGDAYGRDRLAAMFWPDSDPERSRGALRRTLSALRTSGAGPWIDTDGHRVALKPARLRVDVSEFRRLLEASRLAEAADLYRGEFLAGFSLRDSAEFDEWQTEQAEALRRDLAAALARLARHRAEDGDTRAAIGYAQRWLSLDPLHEPAHRELMRLYAAAGDRAAALRQYAECVRRLDGELGVTPLPDTARLAAEIRDGAVGAPNPRTAAARVVERNAAAVQEALADVHTLHGEYAKAIASYESAAAAAAAGGDRRRAIEHKLAEVHHRRGEWERAETHYRAALQGEVDDGRRARLQADWSLAAHRRGESGRAKRLATEALDLARRAGDRRALAQVHNILGILARDQGHHLVAREHLRDSLQLARELGDAGVHMAALNNLALACADADQIPEAIALTEQALALAHEQGDRHREAALQNNLADLMRRAGRREEAMRHLKRAVTLFAGIDESTREPEVWKLVAW
jgi:DNA-binding SARP family transcriptional activator